MIPAIISFAQCIPPPSSPFRRPSISNAFVSRCLTSQGHCVPPPIASALSAHTDWILLMPTTGRSYVPVTTGPGACLAAEVADRAKAMPVKAMALRCFMMARVARSTNSLYRTHRTRNPRVRYYIVLSLENRVHCLVVKTGDLAEGITDRDGFRRSRNWTTTTAAVCSCCVSPDCDI